MSPARNQRIFISGGASGLGLALAERYVAAGWRVAVGDVNVAEIPGAHALICDVTRDADWTRARDWLTATWGGVDVVVNNAGVAVGGAIDEVPLADWQWIIDINLLGVVRGCQTFTPLFKAVGAGHFVNVASVAGLVHPPMMSAYAATKAAVVALSESLRSELAPSGIHVSVVCPSFFRTHLHETARSGNSRTQRVMSKLVGESNVSAEAVAADVERGVAAGEFHILTQTDAKVMWRMKRYLPFAVWRRLLDRATRGMMSSK